MGTDIHPFIEVRQPDGTWAPLWEPVLGDWWFDRILDEKMDNGAVALGIVPNPGESEFDAALRWFKSFSKEEVLAQWGTDRRVIWEWPMPGDSEYPRFRSRDYGWFAAIADGVRGRGGRVPRGIPPDLSPKVAAEAEGVDGHSASWALVSELLADPALKDFSQIFWLHENIPDPANTRLFFYFDN